MKQPKSKEQNQPTAYSLRFQDCDDHVIILGDSSDARNKECQSLFEKSAANEIASILIVNNSEPFQHLLESEKFPVITFGTTDSTVHSINPLDVPQGISIPDHIESLTTLFSAVYGFSKFSSFGLKIALQKSYELYGWSLHDSTNSRLPSQIGEDYYYEPFAIPTLNDVFNLLTESLTESGLEAIIRKDAKIEINSNLLPLTTGRNQFIFGCRSEIPVHSIFSKSTIFDLSKCRNKQQRAMYIGSLLMHALIYKQLHPQKKLLIVATDMHKVPSIFRGAQSTEPINFLQEALDSSLASNLNFVMSSSTSSLSLEAPLPRSGKYLIYNIAKQKHIRWLTKNIDELKSADFKQINKDLEHFLVVDDESSLHKQSENPLPSSENLSKVSTDHIPQPLYNSGMNLYEYGKDPYIYLLAYKASESNLFARVFRRFLLHFLTDLTELVQFRQKLINAILGATGNFDENKCPTWALNFASLSIQSDKFFTEKGREHNWSYQQEKDIKDKWYTLLGYAFLPGEDRKIDITVLREFRDQMFALQARPHGPEPGCVHCQSKCYYRTDVKFLIENDSDLIYDFNAAINRTERPRSEHGAGFAQIISDKTVGYDAPDFAYCLLVHLLIHQHLSIEAQKVMLFKSRQYLLFGFEKYQEDDDLEDSKTEENSEGEGKDSEGD